MQVQPYTVPLADLILAFLAEFAGHDAEDPEAFSSPDATDLWRYANQLKSGVSPSQMSVPFSEWGSGGYRPYVSKRGRDLHDGIMQIALSLRK